MDNNFSSEVESQIDNLQSNKRQKGIEYLTKLRGLITQINSINYNGILTSQDNKDSLSLEKNNILASINEEALEIIKDTDTDNTSGTSKKIHELIHINHYQDIQFKINNLNYDMLIYQLKEQDDLLVNTDNELKEADATINASIQSISNAEEEANNLQVAQINLSAQQVKTYLENANTVHEIINSTTTNNILKLTKDINCSGSVSVTANLTVNSNLTTNNLNVSSATVSNANFTNIVKATTITACTLTVNGTLSTSSINTIGKIECADFGATGTCNANNIITNTLTVSSITVPLNQLLKNNELVNSSNITISSSHNCKRLIVKQGCTITLPSSYDEKGEIEIINCSGGSIAIESDGENKPLNIISVTSTTPVNKIFINQKYGCIKLMTIKLSNLNNDTMYWYITGDASTASEENGTSA